MSHFTKTELPVPMTDREALIKAAEFLGCKVLENAKARGWGKNTYAGEIVLQHPKTKFDVALNRNKEGAYEPYADLFTGEVQKIYGTRESPFGKLVARYGAERAKKIARALGHTIYEHVDPQTGTITQRVVIGQ